MHHTHTNNMSPPSPIPCYMRHFQILDKIHSFLKFFSNVPNDRKGKLHLWRTASFKYNFWLAFFSCVVNSRRKENQAEQNSYLIWIENWGGECNAPRHTEYTHYFLISNCSSFFELKITSVHFLNWR